MRGHLSLLLATSFILPLSLCFICFSPIPLAFSLSSSLISPSSSLFLQPSFLPHSPVLFCRLWSIALLCVRCRRARGKGWR